MLLSDSMVSGVWGNIYIYISKSQIIPHIITYKSLHADCSDHFRTHHTLSLTQIAPLHPALIPSVSTSYGRASFASFSTA